MSDPPASPGRRVDVERRMIEVIDGAISKGMTVEEKCLLAIDALKKHPQADEFLKMLLEPEIYRRIYRTNDEMDGK